MPPSQLLRLQLSWIDVALARACAAERRARIVALASGSRQAGRLDNSMPPAEVLLALLAVETPKLRPRRSSATQRTDGLAQASAQLRPAWATRRRTNGATTSAAPASSAAVGTLSSGYSRNGSPLERSIVAPERGN
jgi:hypothetical protein